MKKNPAILFSAITVFLLTAIILAFPAMSLTFALNGLNLWFQKMVPALFPFMVLSGIIIRMNLTDSFIKLLKPLFMPVFKVSPNCLYTIVTGFLCGFPMGASVTAKLYERKEISKKEAEFLLSFCNNIGPVYFLSFALPAIGITSHVLPYLFGMYGLPLLYGIFLRYTVYRSLSPDSLDTIGTPPVTSFLQALDEAVMSSLTAIAKLGGYMIIFNLLNALPALLLPSFGLLKAVLATFLEITGGLKTLSDGAPIVSLCLLSFGGLSCIAQTSSTLQGTGLSLKKYVFHKIVLTLICAFYYGLLIGRAF